MVYFSTVQLKRTLYPLLMYNYTHSDSTPNVDDTAPGTSPMASANPRDSTPTQAMEPPIYDISPPGVPVK